MPRRKPQVPNKASWSRIVHHLILLVAVSLLISGLLIALDPYLIVSESVAEKSLIWGKVAASSSRIDVVFRSKGAFTANYPVNVLVEATRGNDTNKYFEGNHTIKLLIQDSYDYPILKNQEGFPQVGTVSISSLTRTGKGTIIFQYPGTYSACQVLVDGMREPDVDVHLQAPLITIESYALRWQIENDNRRLGVTLVGTSLTLIVIASSATLFPKIKPK